MAPYHTVSQFKCVKALTLLKDVSCEWRDAQHHQETNPCVLQGDTGLYEDGVLRLTKVLSNVDNYFHSTSDPRE